MCLEVGGWSNGPLGKLFRLPVTDKDKNGENYVPSWPFWEQESGSPTLSPKPFPQRLHDPQV